MVQTKDGAIKADLQTTNMAGCGNGCAFVASVENMRTGDVVCTVCLFVWGETGNCDFSIIL